LISNLDRSRFSVRLYCPEGFLADEARRLGLAVHTANFSLLGLAGLVRLLRRQRFEVVNTVLLGAAVLGALGLALSRTSPRLVVTVNNAIIYPGMPLWRRLLVRLAYRLVNSFSPIYFTKSRRVKEELLSLVRVSSRRIHPISNPLRFGSVPSAKDRTGIRAELGIQNGEIAVGVIGALVPQKGHRYLIEAGPSITVRHPNVRFYFVGDGSLRRRLEKFASRICPGRFRFLGERQGSIRCALAMDVVVIPSIFEGLPNVLLEALAVERPVVATDVGGCGEIIQDGENGLLVPAADASALARGVGWMLDHPEGASQMGQRGAAAIRQRCAPERVAEEVGVLLEQAARETLAGGEDAPKRRTILLLISSADIGGAQTHVEWLAQADLANNARMVVACPPGPLLHRLLDTGLEVYTLRLGFFAWLRIAAIRRAIRPQLVHLHLLGAALHGTIGSWFAACHLVYTVHNLVVYPGMTGWKRAAYPFITRIIAGRIARFIAVSEGISQYLVDSLRISPDKVRVIHNGISFSGLEEAGSASGNLRQKIGVPASCLLFGTVGRITFQKGFDLLIEAFGLLALEFPTLHCVIVGDGERRAEIEGLIGKLGLQDRVHLPGFQRGVLPWYRAMDIVVFSSRFEGLPITVIEAAYAGKPIVATDVGGMKEILEDGVSGLLVPPEDSPALAAGIRQLLNNPSRAGDLGRQARTVALNRFEVQRCNQRTMRVYEELCPGITTNAGLPGKAVSIRPLNCQSKETAGNESPGKEPKCISPSGMMT
jgi:glycosyltransferase involved in cell wall biosynthesis